jgi:predicted nucleic acid-binding protein
MIVSDSSPLIYLARVGALNLLHQFFGDVVLPESVRVEVVNNGLKLKAPDALVIKHILDTENWLKEKRLTPAQKSLARNLSENTMLDITDGDAIILARALKVPLLVDDREAVAVCRLVRVKTIGTLGVIIQAIKKEILLKKDGKRLIDGLVDQGFYLSVEVYREAMNILNNL